MTEPNDKVPGLNAPMTTGQKLAIAGMVLAFLANALGLILVMCL